MGVLAERTENSYREGRRMVTPLMGFPGLRLTGSTIRQGVQAETCQLRGILKLATEFEPDVVFPLMDLSLEAGALGMTIDFPENTPPRVPEPSGIAETMLEQLPETVLQYERVQTTLQVVAQLRHELPSHQLVCGYLCGPFTLAALLMGSGNAALATMTDSAGLLRMVEFCNRVGQVYARELIQQGADLICILEPTASLLSPDQCEQFSIPFVREIVQSCRRMECDTILHICGNSTPLIPAMLQAGADMLSLDALANGVNLPELAEEIAHDTLLLGNLNPTGSLLYGSPDEVSAESEQLLSAMDTVPGFVFSSGCDLPYDVPAENIAAMMAAGRRS